MSIFFYDLETSGLNPNAHQICQFAAICDGVEYEVLLQIDLATASREALEVNGYDHRDTRRLSQVDGLARIREIISNHTTKLEGRSGSYYATIGCAWNGKFDDSFIRAHIPKSRLSYKCIDPMSAYMMMFPTERHTLSDAATKFGCLRTAHDALEDVRMLKDVYEVMAAKLRA